MKRGWREPFEDCYKIDRKTGCWLWQRAMMLNGYGQKWHRGKFDGAHRVSWMIYKGSIPEGVYVLHKCDVKACVNPAHLFLGTQSDNLRDMSIKGRTTSCFTKADVRQMKAMRMNGKTFSAIGTIFGVEKSTIHAIVSGKSWRHIS